MAEFVKKGATYADSEAVPEPLVAEMRDGDLVTDPRRLSLDMSGLAGSSSSDDEVGTAPFDAVAFSLAGFWPFDKPLGFAESPQHLFVGDR